MKLEEATLIRQLMESKDFEALTSALNIIRREYIDRLVKTSHQSPSYERDVAFLQGVIAGMANIETVYEEARSAIDRGVTKAKLEALAYAKTK